MFISSDNVSPEDGQDLVNAAVRKRIERCLAIMESDRNLYDKLDRYRQGKHDPVYVPRNAGVEMKALAKNAVTNMCHMIVEAPAQVICVDGYRPGDLSRQESEIMSESPEWDHWQYSDLDRKQFMISRMALTHGHAYVVTEHNDKAGRAISNGVSATNLSAIYEDVANDLTPMTAVWIKQRTGTDWEGIAWDEPTGGRYIVTSGGSEGVSISYDRDLETEHVPVVRFACDIDLNGRTIGVIEPIIPMQDRLNQINMDMSMAATYGAFVVRTITGMERPVKMRPVFELDANGNKVLDPTTGKPIVINRVPELDENGQPIPDEMAINPSRWLIADNKDVQFGSIPATPLNGYLDAISMIKKDIGAVSQTPPNYLIGEIANISAEALQSAEVSLTRKCKAIQQNFGAAWELVLRTACIIDGKTIGEDDYKGEVIWRDMDQRRMSALMDGLYKMSLCGVPPEALWERMGASPQEITRWKEMRDAEENRQLDQQLQEMSATLDIQKKAMPTQPTSVPTGGTPGAKKVTAPTVKPPVAPLKPKGSGSPPKAPSS